MSLSTLPYAHSPHSMLYYTQCFSPANSSAGISKLATIHAQHIFDLDKHRASQYWFVFHNSTGMIPPGIGPLGVVSLTTFPNVSVAEANATMAPFLNATASAGIFGYTSANLTNVNDAQTMTTDSAAGAGIQGSRLVPADVYRNNPTAIGDTYKKLLDMNQTSYVTMLLLRIRISTLTTTPILSQHLGSFYRRR